LVSVLPVPLAEYVRDMVHDHILERGGAFRERGAALRALINAGKAYQEGVPVSEYVREMVHDHIFQRGARFRETGARLKALSNAVKAWLIAYHECVALAAGLPGKESLTATWRRGCRA
jgi:hypothetical protein